MQKWQRAAQQHSKLDHLNVPPIAMADRLAIM
jgi:hypothetical protein